ncbi:MAG: hypothetical protein Q9207_001423 [Kuettlingeria erythrocarpa]
MFFASRQRSVERNSIPVEDLENALSQYCTPPMPDNLTGERASISDAAFKHVTDLLVHLESHQSCQGWSVRPRMYTVLRNVGRLDLFPELIGLGLKDISFPYTVEKLPESLQEDSLRDKFLRQQKYVLTDASQLEKGRHAYTRNADDLFLVVKHLGRGGYGSVDKVWSLMSFRWFARKQFLRKKSSREDQAMLKNFENELSNLKRLSHQHLVKLVGSYTDQKSVAFLMEPIADMNLLTFLEYYKPGQDDTSLRRYFGCLANAVGYLHTQRIRHRDLKPENILIKDLKVYIADFGTALDWSHKLKDTTADVSVPATAHYMAPEVANRMPRKSASDMWSLGVVYLEMVTVLRGRSVSALRKFLEKNGTRHPHVYGNLPATTQWFEELRLQGVGPESDNEPLTWIKDLTQPNPLRRPQPWALTDQIKTSSCSTSFIGICCASDETSPDYPSPPATAYSEEDAEEITLQEQLAAFEPNPRPFGSSIPRSSQHTVEKWLGTVGQSVPGAFPEGQYLEVPYEIVEDPTMETIVHAENVSVDLEVDYLPETTTGYEIAEDDSDDADEGARQGGYEITEDSSGSERTIRPLRPSEIVRSTLSTEPGTSWVESVNGFHLYGDDRSQGSMLQEAISEHLESILELPDSPLAAYTPATSPDQSTARRGDPSPTAAKFRAPTGGSSRKSTPGQKETQLAVNTPSTTDTAPITSSAIESRDHEPVITQPPAPKVVQRKKRTTRQEGPAATTDDEPLTAQPVAPKVARKKKRTDGQEVAEATTGFILPDAVLTGSLAVVLKDHEPLIAQPLAPKLAEVDEQSSGRRGHSLTSANLLAHIEGPTLKSIPSQKNPQPTADTPFATNTALPGTSAVSSKTQKPQAKQPRALKVAWADEQTNGRGVPTATSSVMPQRGLTSEYLVQLEADTSGAASTALEVRPSQRPKVADVSLTKMMAAEDYMQQVWEAASTKATSVLSASTRKALSNLGPGVVWQDRNLHYVERYAKDGKAAAVRELLRAGCSPGTTKKPNYRPLTNAVRAGTLRHNKVVQVLLDHGADVNAVHPATGKTSLHFAIENSYFPGYTNLIRNLLEHAVNPNALDRSKDTPLLQILYGGYEPLEKHKRDALACLLQPHLDTDVNVMPPGTLNMPVHLAVRRRDALAVGMLIKKGSRVNDPNGAGATPLRMAASNCKGKIGDSDFELLRYLLENGANVNETGGEDGNTALHLAAVQGCMQAVRLLLSHEADVRVRDKKGKTPLEAVTANKSKMSDKTFGVIETRLKRMSA